MPTTSRPFMRASIVTDEITLLMPGAGPPPTRIARRGRVREVPLERDAATLVILGSLPVTCVSTALTHRKFTYVPIVKYVSFEFSNLTNVVASHRRTVWRYSGRSLTRK